MSGIPGNTSGRETFRERLEQQYGSRPALYRAVLQFLTGKPVKKAMLPPI